MSIQKRVEEIVGHLTDSPNESINLWRGLKGPFAMDRVTIIDATDPTILEKCGDDLKAKLFLTRQIMKPFRQNPPAPCPECKKIFSFRNLRLQCDTLEKYIREHPELTYVHLHNILHEIKNFPTPIETLIRLCAKLELHLEFSDDCRKDVTSAKKKFGVDVTFCSVENVALPEGCGLFIIDAARKEKEPRIIAEAKRRLADNPELTIITGTSRNPWAKPVPTLTKMLMPFNMAPLKTIQLCTPQPGCGFTMLLIVSDIFHSQV